MGMSYYIVIFILLLMNIIAFLYSQHTRKDAARSHDVRLTIWHEHAREISELKLGLSKLKYGEKLGNADLNGWVNKGNENHREIAKLQKLHSHISTRLNQLIAMYQDLEKEVKTLKK
jgi:hypothetical protein